MYINRTLEKQIINAYIEFACVTIYGARQTGKSTMVKYLIIPFNTNVETTIKAKYKSSTGVDLEIK